MSQLETTQVTRMHRGSGRCIHLITLIHRLTGEEKQIAVFTDSNSFTEVLHEVSHQKVMQGLRGYEVFEALEITAPF